MLLVPNFKMGITCVQQRRQCKVVRFEESRSPRSVQAKLRSIQHKRACMPFESSLRPNHKRREADSAVQYWPYYGEDPLRGVQAALNHCH